MAFDVQDSSIGPVVESVNQKIRGSSFAILRYFLERPVFGVRFAAPPCLGEWTD
jgi:hypothetical protein